MNMFFFFFTFEYLYHHMILHIASDDKGWTWNLVLYKLNLMYWKCARFECKETVVEVKRMSKISCSWLDCWKKFGKKRKNRMNLTIKRARVRVTKLTFNLARFLHFHYLSFSVFLILNISIDLSLLSRTGCTYLYVYHSKLFCGLHLYPFFLCPVLS
jgi:hypothetical protein